MRLLLPLLLLASCVSTPPVEVRSEYGLVRAYDAATAAEVARVLDTYAPAVRARLQSPCSDRPVVHVEPSSRPTCYENWIELPHESGWRFALYHELIHWYADGAWVESLPHFLEEGLADYLTCERFGALDARIAENRVLDGTTFNLTALHALDASDWLKFSDAQADEVYRAGFELIRAIGGPEALRELAEAGRTSPLELREASNQQPRSQP